VARSTEAFWYDSEAESKKQHFSNRGLLRLFGSIPKRFACFCVILSRPTQLLSVRDRPLTVLVTFWIKKGQF